MDPERVKAYLQVACTGLGFDIGEIWWTSGVPSNDSSPSSSPPSSPISSPIVVAGGNTSGYNEQQLIPAGGHRTGLKFVQLYTSKSYENRRNELINPPDSDDENIADTLRPDNKEVDDQNADQHVLSPRLVNSIYQSAQVVWAMSHSPEGLIGRSDIQLQTAVGLPVALDGFGNMCVVVMFSPNIIPSTDDAMEFLHSISQSATSCSIPCLLPVFNENSSHGRQIFALPHSTHGLPHADNELGEGVTARFVSLDEGHNVDEEADVHNEHHLSAAPKDTFGIPMLPCFAELENAALVTPEESIDIFDEASYGVWNTIMNPEDVFREEMIRGDLRTPMDSNFDLQTGNSCFLVEGVGSESMNTDTTSIIVQRDNNQQLQTEFFVTPLSDERKQRLEEFCQAFLGMSVFDIADVWVPAASIGFPDCVQHVMSVLPSNERNEVLRDFNARSANMLIKFWTGAIGRGYSSGNPVWSANSNVFVDPGRSFAFTRANIQTVLAIPVFTGKDVRPSCVVAFYSLVRSGSVPFVLKFVQQALRLLWDGLEKVRPHESIDEDIWKQIEAADLGEMAADIEMQQTFLSKKRRHDFTSGNFATTIPEKTLDDRQTNSLASNLQQINLPSGETITVPLQLDDNYSQYINSAVETSLQAAQTGDYDWSVPVVHLAKVSNRDGSKRAHVLVGQIPTTANTNPPMSPLRLPSPLPMPNPLPMPSKFPNRVVTGIRRSPSTSSPSLSSNLQVPSQDQRSTPSSSPMHSSVSQQIPQFQPAPSSVHSSTPFPQYPSSSVSTFHLSHISPNVSAPVNRFSPTVQTPASQDTGQINQIYNGISYQDQRVQYLSQIHPPLSMLQTESGQQWTQHNTSFHPAPQTQNSLQFDHLIQPQALIDQGFPSCSVQGQSQQIQFVSQPAQSPLVQTQSHQQQQPNLTTPDFLPQSLVNEMAPNNQINNQNAPGFSLQQLPLSNQPEIHVGFVNQAISGIGNPDLNDLSTNSFEKNSSGTMSLAVAFCMPTSQSASTFSNGSFSDDDDAGDDSGVPKCCRIDGCTEVAVSRRPYCVKHSGNRMCEHSGCPKCAQGSTRFCIAHGGGRRCTFAGCDKGARDKFFCAAHGGGKRCSADDCSKSAVGGSSYCTAHGGGRRCSIQGCDKSAQSSTRFCVKHGGGKKCAQDECEKVARGRTNFCAAHGGGIRCKLAGCNRVAIGKMQLCRTHGGGARQNKKSSGSHVSSENSLKEADSDSVYFDRPNHTLVEAHPVFSASRI